MAGIFLPRRGIKQKPPVGTQFNPNCALLRGLQAMYVFNEGGGNSFAEVSGQNPAATVISGTTVSQWGDGLFGPAYRSTNTNGYGSGGNICDNLANFTVSVWFKGFASAANGPLVAKIGTGGFASGPGWGVFQEASTGHFLVITQLAGGAVFHQLTTNTNFADSKWHHGVFTVSGYAPQKIYIDGVPVATTLSGSGSILTTTNTANLTFGQDVTGDLFQGSLDVIGVWNRVLTADEIERLYVEPFYFMNPGGQNLLSKGVISKGTSPTTSIVASVAVAGAGGALVKGTTAIAPSVSVVGKGSSLQSGKAVIAPNISVAGAGFAGGSASIAQRQRSWGKRKPPPGTFFNGHSLINRLAFACLLNEGGGSSSKELLSNRLGTFSFSPSLPANFQFSDGQFGTTLQFPGQNTAHLSFTSIPAYTDVGLAGPMSVSYWFNFPSSLLSFGATIMGKSDSSDGQVGSTAGWNINVDESNGMGGNSPTFNMKLEFERSGVNKMCGVDMTNLCDSKWHHYVICTAGGAATPTVDDYTIYLDGVLIPQGAANRNFFSGTGNDTTSDAAYPFALGSHSNGANPFTGFLDTVLIHNRVLSSNEAQQLYTDPFCFISRSKKLVVSQFISTPIPPPIPTAIIGGHFLPGKHKRTLSNILTVYNKAKNLSRKETKELRDAISEFLEPIDARQAILPDITKIDHSALEANEEAYRRYSQALLNIEERLQMMEKTKLSLLAKQQEEDDELLLLATIACLIH